MNYNDLINASEAIKTLANEKISIKEAVSLARLIKKMDEELTVFREQNMKILQKYGTQNDEGSYNINNNDIDKYNQDMVELLNTELEKEYDLIEISSDVKLTTSEVISLEKFISFVI